MLTGEQRLHHQAVNLLPASVAFARDLTPSDFCLRDVSGRDAMSIVQILADVAEALAREKYGKPRVRVPAGRGHPVDDEPQAENRRRSPARPGQGGAEVCPAPEQPRSHGPTERGEPAPGGDRLFPDPLEHLTEKQRQCLLAIAREEREGLPPISGPDLSGMLGHASYWAQPALLQLRKAGLIAKNRPGRLGGWALTDPGRVLIASARAAREGGAT